MIEDSNSIIAHKKIIKVFTELQNYQDALTFSEKLILINPIDKDSYLIKGIILGKLKNYT